MPACLLNARFPVSSPSENSASLCQCGGPQQWKDTKLIIIPPQVKHSFLFSWGWEKGKSLRNIFCCFKTQQWWLESINQIGGVFFSQTCGTAPSIIRFWVHKKCQHLLPALCMLPVWGDCSGLTTAFVLTNRENSVKPGAGLLAKGLWDWHYLWDWEQRRKKERKDIELRMPHSLVQFSLMSLCLN